MLVGFRNQDLLDNASPAYVGDGGLGKAPHVRELIEGADLILAIGLRFGEILTEGYTLFDVPDPRQRLIHVHPSDAELNKIYTAYLPVQAHPDLLMPALAAARARRHRGLGARAPRPPAPPGSRASPPRRSRASSTWARWCATSRPSCRATRS